MLLVEDEGGWMVVHVGVPDGERAVGARRDDEPGGEG